MGDAAGMFPIDSDTCDYDEKMVQKFDDLTAKYGYDWKLRDIFPKGTCAGEAAGVLTKEGAGFLDETGNLEAGIPMCPPEGDAGTGMTATNSVAPRTGNVSAGTSTFAMIVLEKQLSKVYREIDMVTTPSGFPCAMSHANNGTSDLNVWVGLFGEFAKLMGYMQEIVEDGTRSILFSTHITEDLDQIGDLHSSDGLRTSDTGFNAGRTCRSLSPFTWYKRTTGAVRFSNGRLSKFQ